MRKKNKNQLSNDHLSRINQSISLNEQTSFSRLINQLHQVSLLFSRLENNNTASYIQENNFQSITVFFKNFSAEKIGNLFLKDKENEIAKEISKIDGFSPLGFFRPVDKEKYALALEMLISGKLKTLNTLNLPVSLLKKEKAIFDSINFIREEISKKSTAIISQEKNGINSSKFTRHTKSSINHFTLKLESIFINFIKNKDSIKLTNTSNLTLSDFSDLSNLDCIAEIYETILKDIEELHKDFSIFFSEESQEKAVIQIKQIGIELSTLIPKVSSIRLTPEETGLYLQAKENLEIINHYLESDNNKLIVPDRFISESNLSVSFLNLMIAFKKSDLKTEEEQIPYMRSMYRTEMVFYRSEKNIKHTGNGDILTPKQKVLG